MEKTLLNRFINSHDQLICQLRAEIDELRPIIISYPELEKHKANLEHEIQIAIFEYKQGLQDKQNMIDEIQRQIDNQKTFKDSLNQQLIRTQQYRVSLAQQRQTFMKQVEQISETLFMCKEQHQKSLSRLEQTINNIQDLEKCINQIKIDIRINCADLKTKTKEQKQSQKCISEYTSAKSQTLHQSSQISAIIKKLTYSREQMIKKIDEYEQKIEKTLKGIEELQSRKKIAIDNEIKKSEELIRIKKMTEHTNKVLQSQRLISKNLDISQNKLLDLCSRKMGEIERLSLGSDKIIQKISKKQLNLTKKIAMHQQLQQHMINLQNANHKLTDAIELSFNQDEKVSSILKEKTRDYWINARKGINQNELYDITNVFAKRKVEKSKTVESSEIDDNSVLNE